MAAERSPKQLALGKYRHPETSHEVEVVHDSQARAFVQAGFVYVAEKESKQPKAAENAEKESK